MVTGRAGAARCWSRLRCSYLAAAGWRRHCALQSVCGTMSRSYRVGFQVMHYCGTDMCISPQVRFEAHVSAKRRQEAPLCSSDGLGVVSGDMHTSCSEDISCGGDGEGLLIYERFINVCIPAVYGTEWCRSDVAQFPCHSDGVAQAPLCIIDGPSYLPRATSNSEAEEGVVSGSGFKLAECFSSRSCMRDGLSIHASVFNARYTACGVEGFCSDVACISRLCEGLAHKRSGWEGTCAVSRNVASCSRDGSIHTRVLNARSTVHEVDWFCLYLACFPRQSKGLAHKHPGLEGTVDVSRVVVSCSRDGCVSCISDLAFRVRVYSVSVMAAGSEYFSFGNRNSEPVGLHWAGRAKSEGPLLMSVGPAVRAAKIAVCMSCISGGIGEHFSTIRYQNRRNGSVVNVKLLQDYFHWNDRCISEGSSPKCFGLNAKCSQGSVSASCIRAGIEVAASTRDYARAGREDGDGGPCYDGGGGPAFTSQQALLLLSFVSAVGRTLGIQ